jgi:DNA-binding NtrC family response regulator
VAAGCPSGPPDSEPTSRYDGLGSTDRRDWATARPSRTMSPLMEDLWVRAAYVAPLDSTVLITGESGVG